MEPLFLSDHREVGVCEKFVTKIGRSVRNLCVIDNWNEVSWPNFIRKIAGLFITLFVGYVFFGVTYLAHRDHVRLFIMPHEWLGLALIIVYTFGGFIFWLSYDITTFFLRLKRKCTSKNCLFH